MHEDVSDLRDVVDAINRLCDTMKTSYDEVSSELVDAANALDDGSAAAVETDAFVSSYTEPASVDVSSRPVDAIESDVFVSSYTEPVSVDIASRPVDAVESDVFVSNYTEPVIVDIASRPVAAVESDVFVSSYTEPVDIVDVSTIVSPEEVSTRTVDPSERWSDSLMSLPLETVTSEFEPVAQCDALSEMYYTASSEVSLLSDTEIPERVVNVDEEALDEKEKDDRKECVIAGHVAAMRERFESMTRTNTPCPDLMRSSSPSLDVIRNITPSPDRLG